VTPRAARFVPGLVVVGLVLRLAFALLYWQQQPLTHDEREYLALGRSVAGGEGFEYPADEPAPGTSQRFGRAPGYPLFLAALHVTDQAEHVPRRVQIAQALLGAAAIWLLATIASRAAGPEAAVIAAAIAAVYPPLVALPAYAFSETLFSTLALAAALALQDGGPRTERASRATEVGGRGTEAGGRGTEAGGRGWVLGAVLTALAALTRPTMLLFVPLGAIWLARRAGVARAAIFCVVVFACIAPWTVRNHRVYGRWIAIASEGGVTFWTGNHPLARGEGDLAANPDLKRAELAFRSAHPGLTPEQLEPLYYRDALAWMRANPRAWIALVARKAFYTVVPAGPSYALHSARYRIASAAPYLVLLPFAAVGAWRWRIARRAGTAGTSPAPLWLMAAATVLAGLIFFPQERFRLPIIDPSLIVSAALLPGTRRATGRE
jgi:4-amino-4-deoxy-L-arabinose transferase-like glycosyltransferase